MEGTHSLAAVESGEAKVDGNGLCHEAPRFAKLTGLIGDHAEKMQRIRIARILLQ